MFIYDTFISIVDFINWYQLEEGVLKFLLFSFWCLVVPIVYFVCTLVYLLGAFLIQFLCAYQKSNIIIIIITP